MTKRVLHTVKKEKSETEYQTIIANMIGGEIEYKLPNGLFIDIVTHTHAYEVDFADKWYEAIGQALAYSFFSNKKAGIYLLCFSKNDFKKGKLLMEVVKGKKLKIEVNVVNCNSL